MSGTRSYVVQCAECGTRHELPAYRCEQCDGALVLERATDEPLTRHNVTLGEGHTPMLAAPWLAPDGGAVHLKLESSNPTLSFKDRAMALGVSMALDLGMSGLVLASTGNAAVSAAAYAAAAGLRCRIYGAHGSKADTKLAMAAGFGAEVHVVDGDYSDAYRAAAEAEGAGWFNVTTTFRNPVLTAAYHDMATELVSDLGRVPDAVIVPIGAGPLLAGLHAGFAKLVGPHGRVPRMIGVQAAACAPLARAWNAENWLSSLSTPLPAEPTVAGAIADSLRGYEREGLLTLAAVRQSDGYVTAVSDDTLLGAMWELAAHGIAVEPASAAAILPVPDLTAPDACVVAVLTAHAAKEPRAIWTEPES